MHESVTSQSLLYITVRELYDLQSQEHIQKSGNVRDGSITVGSPALTKGAPSPSSLVKASWADLIVPHEFLSE
jgi:hypothetical protein